MASNVIDTMMNPQNPSLADYIRQTQGSPSSNSQEPGGVAGPIAGQPVQTGTLPGGGVGQYASQMGGFNSDKLQGKDDAKYDIGRVLSNYDPTKGIQQPGLIDALNSLGFGTFGGSGDNLTFTGETDKGRQAGLENNYSGGDFISDYTGNDPNDHSGARWQYGDTAADQANSGTDKSALALALLQKVMPMIGQTPAFQTGSSQAPNTSSSATPSGNPIQTTQVQAATPTTSISPDILAQLAKGQYGNQ